MGVTFDTPSFFFRSRCSSFIFFPLFFPFFFFFFFILCLARQAGRTYPCIDRAVRLSSPHSGGRLSWMVPLCKQNLPTHSSCSILPPSCYTVGCEGPHSLKERNKYRHSGNAHTHTHTRTHTHTHTATLTHTYCTFTHSTCGRVNVVLTSFSEAWLQMCDIWVHHNQTTWILAAVLVSLDRTLTRNMC